MQTGGFKTGGIQMENSVEYVKAGLRAGFKLRKQGVRFKVRSKE